MAARPPSSSSFLRSRTRTGSAGTPVNYTRSERAHGPVDMPDNARAAREELVRGAAADVTRWRGETSTFIEFSDRRSAQLFAHDPTEFSRSGFNHRAEVVPSPRTVHVDTWGRTTRVVLAPHFHRTGEIPVHPALEGKELWNAATIDAEAARLRKLREAPPRRSTLRPQSDTYESPEAREARRMVELRAERAAHAEGVLAPAVLEEARAGALRWTGSIRAGPTLREAIIPALPPPGSSTIAAAVAAAAAGGMGLDAHYARTLGREGAARPRGRSVPSSMRRSGGTGRAVERSAFYHSGVFELPPVYRAAAAVEGAEGAKHVAPAWSCCGATAHGGGGCCARLRDPDRWQLDN